MSLLRDKKLMSRDKSVNWSLSCRTTLSVNVCDIIFSAYDKFLACDVTSLIYCFLDPWLGLAIY